MINQVSNISSQQVHISDCWIKKQSIHYATQMNYGKAVLINASKHSLYNSSANQKKICNNIPHLALLETS